MAAPADMPFSVRSVGLGRMLPGDISKERVIPFAHFIWTVSGKGIQWRNGKKLKIQQGDICTFLPGDQHQMSCEGNTAWEYRWFTLDGPAVRKVTENFGFKDAPFQAGPCPIETFLRLEEQIVQPGESATREPVAEVFTLLLELAARKSAAHSHKDYPAVVQEAICKIRNRYADSHFGVETLADELRLHRSSFSRTFANATGISPKKFIDSLRLNKSKIRLRQTKQPIADIATSCGFSNANYFCKFFLKHEDCSPGAFRKMNDF